MLNDASILEQVRAGSAPVTWQVLHAKRSYLVRHIVWRVVVVIVAVAVAISLTATGTAEGVGLNDQTPQHVLQIWFGIDLLVLLAVVIFCAVPATRFLRQMGSAGDQVLVLTPNGFVLRTGKADGQITACDFAAYSRVKTSWRVGALSVALAPRAGGKLFKVRIDRRFGTLKPIARQISGAFASSVAARTSAPHAEATS